MFEAKLTEGIILKKMIEAIKDLVTDVNIDVGPSGTYPVLSNCEQECRSRPWTLPMLRLYH